MAAKDETSTVRIDVLRSLLRPLVSFCIRRSYSIQDFIALTKRVFLDLAEEEIRKKSDKVNVSRLSVLTGLHRKEVARIYVDEMKPPEKPVSVLGRVIGLWQTNTRFTTKKGEPRILTFKGENSEFSELVRSISQNINPGTVLFELERMGAVVKSSLGLKLQRDVVSYAGDPRRGFELLARDMDGLMRAAECNLLEKYEIPHLHLHTEYDKISEKDVPKIKRWFVHEGKLFHKKARKFLSQFDSDINPSKTVVSQVQEEPTTRVVLGTFSMTFDKKNS